MTTTAARPQGLAVRDLTVRFGATVAVDDVDLDVVPGEVVALLGASGSGKSSLLRGIAGLEPLTAGTVAWDGEDLTAVPVHRRGFGVMFQDGQLFPHRDVAGNVAYGLRGLSRADRTARVAGLLELVGLTGFERRSVTSLSGGQAQRVALARSLAPQPRLLLLDEPLSALDRALREHLVGVLRSSLKATGTTAIYVTHDQDEAFAVADRIAILRDGRLAQVDTPERLWREPADAEVAGFLGYAPILDADAAAALGWPDRLPHGHRLAVAPGGLVATAYVPDEDRSAATEPGAGGRLDAPTLVGGVRALITDQVDHRGYVAIAVTLPARRPTADGQVVIDGRPTTARAAHRIPGPEAWVRLDRARCVEVPADPAPAGMDTPATEAADRRVAPTRG